MVLGSWPELCGRDIQVRLCVAEFGQGGGRDSLFVRGPRRTNLPWYSIRGEGRRAGGARPLRGRVGGSVAFAARGCWWLSEDAPGVEGWIPQDRRAGAVYGGVVGYAPGGL